MEMPRIFVFFLVSVTWPLASQKLDERKVYEIAAIGFWNVENLYDTLNDPYKQDDEFTPDGRYGWNSARYYTKISRLATVIGQMATDITPDGLAMLGLCEVENREVLRDLVSSPEIRRRNYQIVHIEGPDARGIDPALLYNPRYFEPDNTLAYRVTLKTDPTHTTRDILVAGGKLCGEPVAVLVNHWPSRRGGELQSRANRLAAAAQVRQIADSISRASPATKVIIMGDFNDDPLSESVKKQLGTSAELSGAEPGSYFNPMEALYKKGIGTLAWRDAWHLFDQILLHRHWWPGDYHSWQYYAVRVYNKEFLKTAFGNFKGYPFRTYSGGIYTGGYSDHFPSYILIARDQQDGDPSQR